MNSQPQVFTAHPSPALAVHSQTSAIPACPIGLDKLWEGFSLQKLESNGQSVQIDLAKPESCLPLFSITLSTSCGIDGDCQQAQRNDRTYWLLSNNSIGTEAILEADAEDVISRCTVCETTKPVLAIHSQSVEGLKCPNGWDDLWTGYSYLTVAIYFFDYWKSFIYSFYFYRAIISVAKLKPFKVPVLAYVNLENHFLLNV